MFWKIVFCLYSFLLTGFFAWSSFNCRNGLDDVVKIPDKDVLLASGVVLMAFILFNIFHSLGRRVNFTSPVAAGCFLVPISISFLNTYKELLLEERILNKFI